jgi:hypothetical protein
MQVVYISLALKPSAIKNFAEILRPFPRDHIAIVSTRLDSNLAAFHLFWNYRLELLHGPAQFSSYNSPAELSQFCGSVSCDNLTKVRWPLPSGRLQLLSSAVFEERWFMHGTLQTSSRTKPHGLRTSRRA